MSTFQTTNFNHSTVLVRVDFNVPLDENKNVTDDTRIQAALPTIIKIISDGGTPILMSHLGRPKGKKNKKFSLNQISCYFQKVINKKVGFEDVQVIFVEDCIGKQTVNIQKKERVVYVLENLRFYKEEEKGNENFAKKLSQHGDYYVNDAFGTAHRAHASTAIVAKYFPKDKKMFGYLMENEVNNANKVLKTAKKPLTAIIGGAKVSDKILILHNLINIANSIIIGGGMAYTFLKAKGFNIGKSLYEKQRLDDAKHILSVAKKRNVNILLPYDHHAAKDFNETSKSTFTSDENIPDDFMGLDIGAKSIKFFDEEITKSKTLLWNGPMGVFEMNKFQEGTKRIAMSISLSTQKGSFSLVGGGDSVAAVNLFNLKNSISYVSTGGGALLEYFEGKKLPGIAAIET